MFGGDVGEGIFIDGYEGDVADGTRPLIAKWLDDITALSAALEGSRVCSASDLSCAVWRCVGEVAFGVVPNMIFFVDHWRLRPPPD